MAKKPTYEELKQRVNVLEREAVRREQVEDSLKESEERFSAMFEHMGTGVAIYESVDNGEDFIFRAFNSAAERITRISRNEALGNRLLDLFPHMDKAGLLGSLQQVWKTGQDEYLPPFYYKDEIREGWRENRIYKLPSGEVVALFDDVTERMQAEEALRESEEQFSAFMDYLPAIVFIKDKDSRTEFINKRMRDVLGADDNWRGRTPLEIFGDSDLARQMIEDDKRAMAVGFELREESIPDEDGTERLYETRKFRIDRKGRPPLLGGIALDITSRKQVEKALRESEEKYRILFEKANIAISVVQDGIIKSPNPKLLDLHGYSEEEITSIPFRHFIHPEDRDMVQVRHERRLRGEELPTTYSYRILDKAGDTKWVELNVVPILWEGKPATLCFLTDITNQKQAEEKRKKLEAQFQHAQRMESIGTLAGGLAHNFNNLLMSIIGNASIMLFDIDSSHPHYQHLKNIEKNVQSGSKLTKQLLGYAREGRYDVKPISLNQLVKETSDTFDEARKEIMVHQEFAEKLYGIEADQGQIEQVLLNLYVNAADAMPTGGDLFLKTMNITHEDMKDKPYEPKPGSYVLLTIRDTGIGMDKKSMERIFDPFFTTKGLAQGTGLGLASAYGIIKAHGGYIDVDSEKGQGTAFSIYLPATEEEIVEEEELAGEIVEGEETVLLVDDEEMVLDAGEKMLKRLGYEVLLASSGQEALELYEKNQNRIDMVLLDMVMPGVGGGETYDRMKEINPKVKVLLSSGYSIDGEAKEILKRGCDAFIQKPFSMERLSQSIREILDKE